MKLKTGKMNKVVKICLILVLGMPFQIFAKAGVADGAFEFILTLVGFLLIIAVTYTGIEYLIRNGRDIFNHFKSFLKKKIPAPKKPV